MSEGESERLSGCVCVCDRMTVIIRSYTPVRLQFHRHLHALDHLLQAHADFLRNTQLYVVAVIKTNFFLQPTRQVPHFTPPSLCAQCTLSRWCLPLYTAHINTHPEGGSLGVIGAPALLHQLQQLRRHVGMQTRPHSLRCDLMQH